MTTTRSAEQLMFVLDATASALGAVGPENIEIVTLTRSHICLQPIDAIRGEEFAQTLGCDQPLDHRMFAPGHTLWTGMRDGLEVQVRSALRQVVAR